MQQTDLIHSGSMHLSPCPGQDPEPSCQPERIISCPPGEKNSHAQRTLSARHIHHAMSFDLNKISSHSLRESIGDKGMVLLQMQRENLSIPQPQFQCVTTDMVAAIEQHSLDTLRLSPYIPGIADELTQKTTLADIKAHINTLPAANQDKRTDWLAGLSQFIASDDFYELVKDSAAVWQIRSLDMPLPPVIVRSSGIDDDNYGYAPAGKYHSEIQGDEDVLRPCLKVMASAYRPGVCTTLQPMALIIQRFIDCRYGGVATSYQSLQDDTIRVEYTPGQPRGAVAGLSDTQPHRIDIGRGTAQPQFTPGQVSSCYVLRKNGDGSYSEVKTSSLASGGQRLSDGSVAELKKTLTTLEDLFLCPVDMEFAIDHQGRLFVLQVRPATRLSGAMEFAMPIPSDIVATGEGVSEGHCTGTLWSARNQGAEIMPEGAILVARHGEPWMLAPENLRRAAGFVFAAGGSNDHVAIALRQAGKPCLLAGGHYPAASTRHGRQATLACARFNGTPEAFIVEGDLSAQLTQHKMASSASEAVKFPEVQPLRDVLLPSVGTFDRVDSGFRWLTEQNARLLAFFAPGGGLDCLSNPITLSMSAQRSEIVAVARDIINQLVQGTEALLCGYEAFLQPAGNDQLRIRPFLNKLPTLTIRFEVLKQTITSKLEMVLAYLNNDQELSESGGGFQGWVATCQQLQSCLQELHPGKTFQVRSVHDLIFVLHRRSVNALKTVASVSGQGRLTIKERISCVDYIPPGEEGLLRESDKASIEQLSVKVSLINMVDALIVNLCFGTQFATIKLLENAEGGKRRTLRLNYSEEFHEVDGSDNPGKLKRMWFLVQLLKATGVNKDAGETKVCVNAAAREVTVECSRMASRQAMQDALEILIDLFKEFGDDYKLGATPFYDIGQWDFNKLAHLLDCHGSTQADRFAFNQCLFSCANLYRTRLPRYYRFLSNQHQQFIDHARRNRFFRGTYQEMLMDDEMDQRARRELLHHLLTFDSYTATCLIEQEYNLENKYFVLMPSYDYSLKFHIHPDEPLSDNDREYVKQILLQDGMQFASQSVRNDKNAVLPQIKKRGWDLMYVSEELKRDKEVVMAAVCQTGYALSFASPELQDDDEVVMAAIMNDPKALHNASERIRCDKKFIQVAIEDDIDNLCCVSETLLNDPGYMLSMIKDNARAFMFRGRELSTKRSFTDAAILCNPLAGKYP